MTFYLLLPLFRSSDLIYDFIYSLFQSSSCCAVCSTIYSRNEYVTIAVNRNLSNSETSPKKNFFSGYCLNCDSLRWSHTHFICIPPVYIISFNIQSIEKPLSCENHTPLKTKLFRLVADAIELHMAIETMQAYLSAIHFELA